MAGRTRNRGREADEKIAKKAKEKKASPAKSIRGFSTLCATIASIKQEVERYLGHKKDQFILINTVDELDKYIKDCIRVGYVAIDTETTGLDPMNLDIVGFSMYAPGLKACYVPINHIDYMTGTRIENQLTEVAVKPYLQKLVDYNVKTIFFNAPFDIRVIRHTIGVYITPYYDGYIAARLLNENERVNKLKPLHAKYCLQGKEEEFSFGELFKNVNFQMIPIQTAYLYAANDAPLTWELYQFQLPYLTQDNPDCIDMDLTGVAYIFWHIEMPLVTVVADIDDRGVKFDFEYAKKLSVEYHSELERTEERYKEELKKYSDNYYSISSPVQLANLFYDELGLLKPVFDRKDNKWKRPTGEEVLTELNHPLCPIILEYRNCRKMLSTYIDKMTVIAEKDGRVHCSFNQVGTDTGRFSCKDPNLQNIPSHNTRIRKMFTASDGYVMIGADFSAQEPRMAAHMCNDERMIKAYCEGKDLYCEIASIAFKVPYEDCMEFNPDGSKNPEGKERRSKAKAIVLGICYGKGVRAIGEDLHITKEAAQEIYDTVLTEFPKLREFMEESISMAYHKGYVTTLFGRKRRLPDINLPPFEFTVKGGSQLSPNARYNLTKKLKRMWFKDRQKYIEELKNEGIYVKDNGGFIAQAERQCVNARIQGKPNR